MTEAHITAMIFVIAILAWAFGYRVGHRCGEETGIAQGWIDRGLDDWRKNIERRDAQGKFKRRETK